MHFAQTHLNPAPTADDCVLAAILPASRLAFQRVAQNISQTFYLIDSVGFIRNIINLHAQASNRRLGCRLEALCCFQFFMILI